MNGKIVSFINMKGGVGKTTLCIGIAEYLAHYMNKKVLIIDLDPQFNATQSMMNFYDLTEKYLADYFENKTVIKLFESPKTISDRPCLPSASELILDLDQNISIILGTINLIFEDKNNSSARTTRVKKFITENSLRNIYDYIFIDCPPTISLYTDAALIASDFYLVPIKIDRYSVVGVQLLRQVIDRLTYDAELNIQPLGKIFTMIDKTTEKTKEIINLIEQDGSSEIKTFSSRTQSVRDLMVGLKGNIASQYSKSRKDIKDICREFIERIGNYGKKCH